MRLGGWGVWPAAMERAIESAPHRTDFHHNLSVMRRCEAGDPHLAKMEALAAEMDSLPEHQPVTLHFALGKGSTAPLLAELRRP